MNTTMFDIEAQYLDQMSEGRGISPQLDGLYRQVRRAALLSGAHLPFDKQFLSLIYALCEAPAGNPRPTSDRQPQAKPVAGEAKAYITPAEDPGSDEWGQIEQGFKGAANSEYTGPRLNWETDFKSVPGDPVKKWERNRPISYIDQEDGAVYGASFIKINPNNKELAIVRSSRMKKNYSVPLRSITLNDLSPPSPVPLAVQI